MKKAETMTVEIPCSIYHDFLRWRIKEGCLDTPGYAESVEEAMAQNRAYMGVEFHSTDALVNQVPSPEFDLRPEKRMVDDEPEKGEDKTNGLEIDKAWVDEWSEADDVISELSQRVIRERKINDTFIKLIDKLIE